MASQRLKDKVCIVTGSSSGLGRAIATAYSREGALLVCSDLRPEPRLDVGENSAVTTHDLIKNNGGRAIFVETDVSNADAVQAMVDKAVAEYGRIDVLVNNAGIAIETAQAPSRIHETPEDVFDKTLAVNTRSVFLTCKYVIPQMLKQDPTSSGDRGYIVNIASIMGVVGTYRAFSYCTSKAGVISMTRAVALDYAKDGIHSNSISPGFVETAMVQDIETRVGTLDNLRARHPLHGLGTPDDLVGAAIFLASAEARWMTGSNLVVDGGYTAQ